MLDFIKRKVNVVGTYIIRYLDVINTNGFIIFKNIYGNLNDAHLHIKRWLQYLNDAHLHVKRRLQYLNEKGELASSSKIVMAVLAGYVCHHRYAVSYQVFYLRKDPFSKPIRIMHDTDLLGENEVIGQKVLWGPKGVFTSPVDSCLVNLNYFTCGRGMVLFLICCISYFFIIMIITQAGMLGDMIAGAATICFVALIGGLLGLAVDIYMFEDMLSSRITIPSEGGGNFPLITISSYDDIPTKRFLTGLLRGVDPHGALTIEADNDIILTYTVSEEEEQCQYEIVDNEEDARTKRTQQWKAILKGSCILFLAGAGLAGLSALVYEATKSDK